MSNTQQTLNIDPVAVAQGHLNRGFKVIPVYFKGKKPLKELGSWQTTEVTTETIPNLFNKKEINYGGILNNLIDIDLDCRAANFMAKEGILPNTKMIFGRKSSPMSHYIFRREKDLKSKRYEDEKGKCLVEIRTGSGYQSILPESVHESGERVTWVVDQEPTLIDPAVIKERVGKIAALSYFANRYPEVGSRDQACLHIAGFLLRSGFRVSESDEFIQLIAQFNQDEEWHTRLKSQATKNKIDTDEKVYGIPSLKKFFDIPDKQMKEILDWLGIERKTEEVEEKFVPIRSECLNDVDFNAIPKRKWLIEKIAQRGEITLIVGPGGVNKSTAASQLLVNTAAHKSFFGHRILQHDLKVHFLTNEESKDEVRRKLAAACLHLGLDKADVKKRIHYYSGKINNVDLFGNNQSKRQTSRYFEDLKREYKELQPDLIILDPFATFHPYDENGNSIMAWVMKKLTALCYVSEKPSAMIVVHHAGKNLYINPKQPFDFDKRQAHGRGATSIISAARIAFNMGTMNPNIAKDYNVDEKDCHNYVCLVDAKMNFSDLRAEPLWFEKEIENINGEMMVALTESDISDNKRTAKQRLEIAKHDLANKLYPFIKGMMKNSRCLVDKVANTFFERNEGDLDTTTMGRSVSTFKNKITSMYNKGVVNPSQPFGEPPKDQIIYKYGQQQGEDSKVVHWLVLEDLEKQRQKDPF